MQKYSYSICFCSGNAKDVLSVCFLAGESILQLIFFLKKEENASGYLLPSKKCKLYFLYKHEGIFFRGPSVGFGILNIYLVYTDKAGKSTRK